MLSFTAPRIRSFAGNRESADERLSIPAGCVLSHALCSDQPLWGSAPCSEKPNAAALIGGAMEWCSPLVEQLQPGTRVLAHIGMLLLVILALPINWGGKDMDGLIPINLQSLEDAK